MCAFGAAPRITPVALPLNLALLAVETPEQAVRGADVVLGVSSTREPLFQGVWLGPATFICAVAVVTPDRRELDDTRDERLHRR